VDEDEDSEQFLDDIAFVCFLDWSDAWRLGIFINERMDGWTVGLGLE
jgi:hypothetical protein